MKTIEQLIATVRTIREELGETPEIVVGLRHAAFNRLVESTDPNDTQLRASAFPELSFTIHGNIRIVCLKDSAP